MSTAADVDLVLDQNADFGVQIYWLDPVLNPYQLAAGMKMEIRSIDLSTVVYTLSDDTSGGITFSASNGLIQLVIPQSATNTLTPGTYFYDLYVHYQENPTTTRVRRLIKGQLTVNQKVTASV
jgi:hypothetical protein